MAPTGYVANMSYPLKQMAPFVQFISQLDQKFAYGEFLPSPQSVLEIKGTICTFSKEFCKVTEFFSKLWSIEGFANRRNINQSRTEVYANHEPSGTSIQVCFLITFFFRFKLIKRKIKMKNKS